MKDFINTNLATLKIAALLFEATPCIFKPSFFTITDLVLGYDFPYIWNHMKAQLIPATCIAWCFFVPLHTINFLYIPPHFRILYNGAISLGWACFLSYFASRFRRWNKKDR